jgi:CubicO group peptidase (beta-lactamase class C family)
MAPEDVLSLPAELIRRFTDPPVHGPDDGAPGAPWPGADTPDGALTATVSRAVAGAPGVHGVVVVQHGRILAEHYGSGHDHAWGRPLGEVAFTPTTLHDVRSVTKSVVALLYGIAWGDGTVPDPSAPLLDQFPEYSDLAADPAKAALTVEHALTMTLGLRWREELPYADPQNGEIAMMLAPDRWRYVLEQPIEIPPGTAWNYSGGASELIGRLVAQGTGVPLHEFARTRLFEPLGIGGFAWMAGHDGVVSAASGLRLAPRDLARIGRLVLDGGAHDGEQIVPAAWIERMLRPAASARWSSRYGYQWYLGGEGRRRWYAAFGNGEQSLFVHPELDVVIAVVTGNYDDGDTGPVGAVTSAVLDHLDPPA